MIGPFVALRETEPTGHTTGIDGIDADDLGFLAAIRGEGRDVERCAVAAKDTAIALVEPLGGGATLARFGPAAFESCIKHLLGIRARGAGVDLLVHGVALLDAASVRQARARNKQ